jgi:hypothetical protein
MEYFYRSGDMKRLILCLMAVGCASTFATTDVQTHGAGNMAAPVAGAQLADNSQPYGTQTPAPAADQGMGNNPSNAAPTQPVNNQATANGVQPQAQPPVPGAENSQGQLFGADPKQANPDDPNSSQNAGQNQEGTGSRCRNWISIDSVRGPHCAD